VDRPAFDPVNLTRFAAFYYNRSLEYGDHVRVINYKDYAMQEHAAVLDLERGQLGEIRPLTWQTDTSISNKSWGYIFFLRFSEFFQQFLICEGVIEFTGDRSEPA
jgi:hypothetical protein